MTLKPFNPYKQKFALLPQTCDKCGRRFVFEPYLAIEVCDHGTYDEVTCMNCCELPVKINED